MYFMLNTETAKTFADYAVIVIPSAIAAVGVVFGGTGFWQWKQAKDEAKRLKAEKESTANDKIDNLTENMASLTGKVDGLTEDIQGLKSDLLLLQKANEETVRYREHRDAKDQTDTMERRAIIESLCGMMRERLLDNYKRCTKKGYYTREEREIYGEMFECYEKAPFNGDGVMHDLRPIMKELPWTADEAGIGDSEDLDDY